MNSNTLHILKNKGGFIMVEMLVSIALIMMVLPGSLAIATKAITTSSYQKNELIATYLAEEGQELMRSIRERNVLIIMRDGSGAWNTGFENGKCQNVACTVDVIAETITAGSGNLENLAQAPNAVYRLYTDATTGLYSHTASGNPTIFYRGIIVTPVTGHPDQVLIRSVVVWRTPFGRREASSSGFLVYWMQ